MLACCSGGSKVADAAADAAAPIVFLSSSASLKGKVNHVQGSSKPVYTYLGIPYAEPPVGELRLKKPVPKQLWEGERDATKPGFSPVQNASMLEGHDFALPLNECGEDCLHVNVYTPSTSSADKLPVMVWIFGGGFAMGSSVSYPGTAWAALQDVVYVAINYRVSLLGFFSTGDDKCRGNFGFWDQIQGLKWVQEHISKFGGDPQNVTVFGESAGGASASMLSMAPPAEGLFHRTIKLSGVATIIPQFRTAEESKTFCATVAQALGLAEGASSDDVLAAVLQLSVEEVIEKGGMLECQPVIDEELFSLPQSELLQQGKFARIPSIIAVNTHEGAVFHNAFFVPMGLELKNKEDFIKYISAMLGMSGKYPAEALETMSKAVLEEFVPQDSPTEDELLAAAIDAISLDMFQYEIDKYVKTYADFVPCQTYYGVYGYRISRSKHPEFVKADHGQDIAPVMGFPLMQTQDVAGFTYTAEDAHMSRQVMAYYGNFARTGSPNGRGVAEWAHYSTESPCYLYMDLDPMEQVKGHFLEQRLQFWHNTVKSCSS